MTPASEFEGGRWRCARTRSSPGARPCLADAAAVRQALRSTRDELAGELLAAGERVALELRPAMRQVDDRIEVDASATVDQRQLGMTWSPLGIAKTPAVVTVHARLRPQ